VASPSQEDAGQSMKKFYSGLLLILCTLLFTATSASAAWVSLGGNQGATVTVLESTPQRIAIECRVDGFEQHDIVVNGQTYAMISLPGEAERLDKGLPELPVVARSLIIPEDRRMELRVTTMDYVDLHGITPIPSKGNLSRAIDPSTVPFSFSAFYSGAAWYPEQDATQREPYIMRDYRGTTVVMTPIRFQPSTGTLRVATRLLIELVDVGLGGANVLVRHGALTAVDASFDELYRGHFLNYGAQHDKYAAVPETGSMLVICNDAFAAAMQPFVDWKNQSGVPTTMVLLSQVGATASQVKTFIADRYNQSSNPKLAFVLLVGDSDQMPSPYTNGGSADPTYGLITGSDWYPEIFVGRFSAENVAQVATQVLRSVNYEKEPLLAGDAWYARGVGIGSAEGPGDNGERDWQHIDNIRTKLINYGYVGVDSIYDPGATHEMVTTALEQGRSIINYTGHGSQNSWGTSGFSSSHVYDLHNENMLPFIFSVACVNGKFASGNCFAEAWLRSTHNGNPTGAVGTYMASINQAWNPPMAAEDEADDLLVQDRARTFGSLCFNGSCGMIDKYGANGAAEFNAWHIFGDPSLRVRTKAPTALVATTLDSILVGTTTLEVATDCPGALCGLADSVTAFGSAVADTNGNATVALLDTLTVGQTLTLTVTGYNRIPHVAQIKVYELPRVEVLVCRPASFEISSDPDSTVTDTLHITNTGAVADTMGFVLNFISRTETASFVSFYPPSARVPTGETTDVVLTFSNRGLSIGPHMGTIQVQPDSGSAIYVPVLLHVGDIAGISGDRGALRTAVLAHGQPNPFTDSATLNYGLPAAQAVLLVVYDASGRTVRTLARGPAEAGYHSVVWNGRDEAGRTVPAGVYFARLQTSGRSLTQRLLRIR
jgi:hypothetical protein